MFMKRDGLETLSPLGSGDCHLREAMFFLMMHGSYEHSAPLERASIPFMLA